jgi:hypothetical protein
MSDSSDLSVADEALAAMRHGELVALLNRLYARAGEPTLSVSTARASSDDELRSRIRAVRRRLLPRAGRPSAAAPDAASPTSERATRGRSTDDDARSRRAFVVLVSDDQSLARRARASCGARGVVLVWVASQATLAKLVTSVTPTDVVIEGAADRVDEASVRELVARGVRFRRCRSAHETLAALAEIE